MRIVGLFSAVVLAGAALVATAGLANSAGEVHYAALGDSYTSGVGTGEYDEESARCRRGPFAYPALWAASHSVAPDRFQFAACADATTTDVRSSQVSALSEDTTLVTVQVGGNDAGFKAVMYDCVGNPLDGPCVDRVEEAKFYIEHNLPRDLHDTYRDIRLHAPNAQVVVIGYPRLYQEHGTCFGGLSERKRAAMNSAADVLAKVLLEQARAAKFNFLDGRSAFDTHGICSSEPWLNGLGWQFDESFHPNRAGHEYGFLAALTGFTG